MANEDKKKGVWIPEEVLELEELNGREMIVLSYYLAFTEKGKQKQCVKKIETVSEELHIPVSTLKRIRGKLRELGYLDTQFLFRGIGTKTNDIRSIKNGTSNRSTKNETPKRCRSTKNGTFRSTKNETPNGIKNGTSQYNEQYLMNNSNEHECIYNVTKPNVQSLEQELVGLVWKDFEDKWKDFLEDVQHGNEAEGVFDIYMKLLPSKTKYPETTVPKWKADYNTSKRKAPKPLRTYPNELLEAVCDWIKKGRNDQQIRSNMEVFGWSKYLNEYREVIQSSKKILSNQ